MQPIPTAAEAVCATLEYLEQAGPKPVTYMLAPPGGHAWDTADHANVPVTIAEGRGRAGALHLDREGYTLHHASSVMRGFADRAAIERQYYPELAELALHASGAGGSVHAVVFDHLVRRRAPGAATPFGARDGKRPGAAMRVHCDFTPASAQRRLALELQRLGLDRQQVTRFTILNLWRSTGLPVLDAPLAMCDARTVAPSDLVAADIVYPTRTGEIFELLYRPAHAWTYFDAMTFDEVLVFKQYDSIDGVARYTPHAAFEHPATPAGTPPRESIEARCLLIHTR
jgi:hypothetical protein